MIIRKIPRRQSKLATQSVPRFDLNSTSAFGWADGEVDSDRERAWMATVMHSCLRVRMVRYGQKDDGHINSLPPNILRLLRQECVCVCWEKLVLWWPMDLHFRFSTKSLLLLLYM